MKSSRQKVLYALEPRVIQTESNFVAFAAMRCESVSREKSLSRQDRSL